jgi:D-sedoheptulose 7-phosphate isomerase
MSSVTESVVAILAETAAAHQRFARTGVKAVADAAEAVARAVTNGHKVIAFGNGGSASDAEHLVAELVGRFEGERRPLAAIALTANSSVVTAISNDYGYEPLFVRQVQALGARGDVAVGISTSGQSRNVEAALDTAKALGLVTIALTGRDGGRMGGRADIHVNVPEQSTPRIQEVHRTILHAMCSAIDRSIASA